MLTETHKLDHLSIMASKKIPFQSPFLTLMILKVADLKVLTSSRDQNIKSFKWVMWGIESKVFGNLVYHKKTHFWPLISKYQRPPEVNIKSIK